MSSTVDFCGWSPMSDWDVTFCPLHPLSGVSFTVSCRSLPVSVACACVTA